MTSPTQRTWVWANSGSWWWTEKPGMLQSLGTQRVGHDWVAELNWTEGPAWESTLALAASFPVLFLPGCLSCSLNLLICSFSCLKPPGLSAPKSPPPPQLCFLGLTQSKTMNIRGSFRWNHSLITYAYEGSLVGGQWVKQPMAGISNTT